VFFNVVEDDRSDNDENEFAEEMRLDALAREKREKLDEGNAPKILMNGQPMNGNGKSSAAEVRTDGVTNRNENRRKA